MGNKGKEVLDANVAIRDGHYAAKQIYCKDRLIAWSHRQRFETGLRLGSIFRSRRLLDYGCGDGTFLALLCAGDDAPASAVGAEIDDAQVDDCRARLGHLPGVTFEHIDKLDGDAHRGAYDGVVCMEVLEHVVALDAIIDRLHRVLATDGTLIISVPIETGLPLLVKQATRRIAGWRGIGDYSGTSPYTVREYVTSVFAGRAPHMTRPIYNLDGPGLPFHDHKGFNWKALADRLSRRFDIQRVLTSPLPFLGAQFATQVWFVARKKTV